MCAVEILFVSRPIIPSCFVDLLILRTYQYVLSCGNLYTITCQYYSHAEYHDNTFFHYLFLHSIPRLNGLFLPEKSGRRPCHGSDTLYATDSDWKDLILFYEYFNGDNGQGCGATYVMHI